MSTVVDPRTKTHTPESRFVLYGVGWAGYETGDCSEEIGWLSALKGQNRTAQGNALGSLMNPMIPSPERAKQSAMSLWFTILFCPFRAGTSGAGFGPQGVALGCPVPPLQGGEELVPRVGQGH
jgi:hypothetical protein